MCHLPPEGSPAPGLLVLCTSVGSVKQLRNTLCGMNLELRFEAKEYLENGSLSENLH